MNQQTNEFYREQQQRDLPQTLPSYPDVDGSGPAVEGVPDTPQTLPSYPDVDGSAPPVYPQPIPPIVTQPGQPVMRCCRVRFFHAAVQAGSLNVNVGSQRVASNLAFGNFSTYYCFAEGFRTVSLINAGSGRTLLLRKTVPMSYGEQLTFVIVNNASTGALELVRVNDTACSGQMGGFGCLRMANFLLGDTALDLLTADGRVLFSDVRYKETTLSRRLRREVIAFWWQTRRCASSRGFRMWRWTGRMAYQSTVSAGLWGDGPAAQLWDAGAPRCAEYSLYHRSGEHRGGAGGGFGKPIDAWVRTEEKENSGVYKKTGSKFS